ncbi:MAG TPA: NAD(P)/FAD-dependent oxidoreductase [Roseiflexaceae bacterium]|nr:NAD(P)/FAD-dependent oxidoreductase [Roseiflexaceae bacterium]
MTSELRETISNGPNGMYDVVIIGAGPTGLFASFYAGMRGMRTLILDALPEPGGQVAVLYPEKFIYDVPGFPKILGRDLVKQLVEQAMTFHPDIRLDEQVRQLTVHGERDIELTTSRGSYRTRSVLISAGVGAFSPNKHNAPGAARFEGNGVHYFVKEKVAFRGKRLLIIGGGDSAVDWALNLKDYAKSVTLIHRRDQFRAHEHSVVELRHSPVEIKTFYELKELHGHGRLAAATIFHNQTKDEQTLEVDSVLIFLGFKADAGPIKSWGLEMEGKGRAIKVGPNFETSLPGVFAAGDIAGVPVKLDLIAVCFGQAAIAINSAKAYVDPQAKVFPGHSSEMKL